MPRGTDKGARHPRAMWATGGASGRGAVGSGLADTEPCCSPLQVALSEMRTAHGTDYGMPMMSALIAVVPLILVFMICAKQFIAGISDGAVK